MNRAVLRLSPQNIAIGCVNAFPGASITVKPALYRVLQAVANKRV